jgi:hypothetical protein
LEGEQANCGEGAKQISEGVLEYHCTVAHMKRANQLLARRLAALEHRLREVGALMMATVALRTFG